MTVAVAFGGGALATQLLTSYSPPPAGECSTDPWPAFSLAFATEKKGEAKGRILWCSPSHWTLDAFRGLEDGWLTQQQASNGEPGAVFSWFAPALSPEEAFRRAAPSRDISSVAPRNRLADVAYIAANDDGIFRMEFTAEGIPVALRWHGDDDFEFWATELDRASRMMFSDEDLMNRPLCDKPNPSLSSEPETDIPCWPESESLWVGHCWKSLTGMTARFQTLSCSF